MRHVTRPTVHKPFRSLAWTVTYPQPGTEVNGEQQFPTWDVAYAWAYMLAAVLRAAREDGGIRRPLTIQAHD